MTRYKLIIAYDGTDFVGWQVQPNGTSVQGMIESVIAKILQKEIRIHGSGRTDSGVHAKAQIAHFDHDEIPDLSLFHTACNRLLPQDIRITECRKTSDHFHSRFSAQGKIYSYHIIHGSPKDPFNRRYRTHVFSSLDVSKIRDAATLFLGSHDFTSFTNLGSPTKNSIRRIDSIDILEEGNHLKLTFRGNGFLYKMVRNMTGALLEVGRGKLKPEAIREILMKRDRQAAPPAAPPTGLFLDKVIYS